MEILMDKVSLSVGSGGRISYNFVNDEILSRFSNTTLDILGDGANLENGLVVTTDTFTVHPPFFDGGNIGILSFCGMVNDLASMGAKPLFMTMGLVIEEGFSMAALRIILDDLKKYALEYDVKLVAGDTKVVEKGKMEGVHINITGIGKSILPYNLPLLDFESGDKVILTGPVGEHSIAVMKARGVIDFDGVISSDVAPLWGVVKALIDGGIKPKFIRDVTRGGLASVLNELAIAGKLKISIAEESIPVNQSVMTVCDIYGFDIYSLACEGRLVMAVSSEDESKTIEILRQHKVSEKSAVIGEIKDISEAIVILDTTYGGRIILDMPLGEVLPRIC
jgi:hydrogenase expression/formation protein HypE